MVYNLGRPIGREVLKMRIWGVPLACLGSSRVGEDRQKIDLDQRSK